MDACKHIHTNANTHIYICIRILLIKQIASYLYCLLRSYVCFSLLGKFSSNIRLSFLKVQVISWLFHKDNMEF